MVSKRQEVATPDTDWSEVSTYQDAFSRFPEVISSTDVIGDGFYLVDKKEAIDREFLIIDWKFLTDKATGREFVSVRAINPHNMRIRFNDGSTGVCAQLREIEAKGIHGGIHCAKGLRVSDYTLEDGTAAKTYYIA